MDTEVGIEIVGRDEQYWKALSPIIVTEVGMEMDVREVQE